MKLEVEQGLTRFSGQVSFISLNDLFSPSFYDFLFPNMRLLEEHDQVPSYIVLTIEVHFPYLGYLLGNSKRVA